MADIFTPEHRSWVMSQVKSANTTPEKVVRSALLRLGYEFTVDGPFNRELPGRPDIVLPRERTVVFVHGCFWHRHEGCKIASFPKSRTEFWKEKFDRNVARDKRTANVIYTCGWRMVTVWECETKNHEALDAMLLQALRRKPGYRSTSGTAQDTVALVAEEPPAYGKKSKRKRRRPK